MEKLTGEEKAFWERAFLGMLPVVYGEAKGDMDEHVIMYVTKAYVESALEVWRERCEPAPDYLNMATLCDECGGPIPKPWPTLTPEEQKLADALSDAPAKPTHVMEGFEMCPCGHPIAAHSEHGCHVRLTPAADSYCSCLQGHGRNFSETEVVEALSVAHQPGYPSAY